MVAISLYRGNLHRVPDVPRRWLMPNRQISLKEFKILLHKRTLALSHLLPSSAIATSAAVTTVGATSSSPNPDPSLKPREDPPKDNGLPNGDAQPQSEPAEVRVPEESHGTCGDVKDGVKDNKGGSEGGDCSAKRVDESVQEAADLKQVAPATAANVASDHGNSQALREDKPDVSLNPNTETNLTSDKVDEFNGKEKRKREVEEKLQVLNAKKHNLVQVLKQILNAEEELKRRNSMQAVATRPSLPLQVDVTNDSGSMTRQVAARMGSEGNLGGDVEGGEADDISNHNTHYRHLHRMSSVSPSSESPLRRPAYIQHNAVPHPSRANLGTAGSPSPSRFAPTGHQGHPANLPTVSVSGTSYIASSPSPAASGGTSVFRDSRLPSPWN